MRILQLFGLGDTSTLLTVGMRELGMDCDLLLSNRAFVTQYPAWTKKYPQLKHGCYHWDASNMMDYHTVSDLYRFARHYDLIFCHPPAGAYAWSIGRPYVMWDGGSGNFILDSKYESNRSSDNIEREIVRRSYKNAQHIFFNDINVIYTAWREMPWMHDRYSYIPLPVDTELFRPMQMTRPEHFTAYLPTRNEVRQKGIEQILQGFKQFTEQVPDARLLITRYGSDVPITQYLVEQLQLKDNVQWVPLVPKQQFARLINIADVVIDQLCLGALGGVSVQAMSCGQRVIVNSNETWYREQLYDTPPVLNVRTADDVCRQLLSCTTDDHQQLRHDAREFVLNHFSYMSVAYAVLERLRTSISSAA